MDLVVDLVFLALAVTASAITISKMEITRGFRTWIATKSQTLGHLFSCPFCLSCWIAAGYFLIHPIMLTENIVISFIIIVPAIVTLSTLLVGLCFHLMLWDKQEIQELQELVDELTDQLEKYMNGDNHNGRW